MSVAAADLEDLELLAEEAVVAPLTWAEWTAPQVAFFRDPAPWRVLFTGNGMGKTRALVAEFIWRARGQHPFRRVHAPPVSMLLVCESFEAQSTIDFASQFAAMVDLREIADGLGYEPGRGFRGRPPRIVWTSGPGAGSELTISTYRAGARKAAGGTRHFVGCNEPMPEALWGELTARGRGVQGELALVFTPTPEHPPQGWLEQKVRGSEVSCTQAALERENLRLVWSPTGVASGRVIDDWARVERQIQSWHPLEREMRLGKSWEAVAGDRLLVGFSDENILQAAPPDPSTGWPRLVVGIDHGSGAGRQRAVILGAHVYHSHTRAHVLAEVAQETATTPRQDAEAISAALARLGATIDQVDYWVGDRRHAGDKWGGEKTNYLLLRAFSELRGCAPKSLPKALQALHVPTKYSGSVYASVRHANGMFLSRHLTVDPSCTELIRCVRTWQGSRTDPAKDIVDAMFYALSEVADPRVTALRERSPQ